VHGRATGGTAMPTSLVVCRLWNVGGTGFDLKAQAVPDIFAQDLHIFVQNQLQISFLLLQDSIFKIFVPEIK